MKDKQFKRQEELKLCILRQFPDMQNRMDQQISYQELQNLLNKMCQKIGVQEYDEAIFEELVEKTQQDFQVLTPNNFLNVYNEAEDVLTLKVEHLQNNTNRDQQNCIYLQDIVSQLNKRQNSQMNQGDRNFLIIDTIKVMNLNPIGGQQNQPFLSLQIGSINQESQVVISQNPVFNLNIKLPVHSFLETFSIYVLDKQRDNYSNQSFQYGSIELKVDALPFFNSQQVQYTLIQHGQQIHSQLQLTCHLEVNDCQRAINDLTQRNQFYQEKINENVEEIKSFEEQIESLQQPFKQNQDFQPQNHNLSPLYNDNQNPPYNQQQQQNFQPNYLQSNNNNNDYQAQHINQQPPIQASPMQSNFNQNGQQNQQYQKQNFQNDNDQTNKSMQSEQNFGRINQNNSNIGMQQQQYMQPQQQQQFVEEQQYIPSNRTPQIEHQEQPNYFEQQQQQQQTYQQPAPQNSNPYMGNGEDDDMGCDSLLEYIKRSDILTFILVILGILQCLKRPEFLDILIGTTFIIFLYKGRFQQHNYQQLLTYYLAALGISIVIDIFWLIKYVSPWGESESSYDQGTEGFLRGLVTFLAIIGFIFKLATAGSYYLLKQGTFQQVSEIESHFQKAITDTYKSHQNSPVKMQEQQQYQQFENEETPVDYNNQI